MIAKIEMPAGTRFKYEERSDGFHVDRILSRKVPFNYGYIPNTLSADGDPTDVFVVTEEPLAQGCTVGVVPYFLVEMEDGGVEDNKYIAGVKGDIAVWEYHAAMVLEYLANYKPGIKIKEITRLI